MTLRPSTKATHLSPCEASTEALECEKASTEALESATAERSMSAADGLPRLPAGRDKRNGTTDTTSSGSGNTDNRHAGKSVLGLGRFGDFFATGSCASSGKFLPTEETSLARGMQPRAEAGTKSKRKDSPTQRQEFALKMALTYRGQDPAQVRSFSLVVVVSLQARCVLNLTAATSRCAALSCHDALAHKYANVVVVTFSTKAKIMVVPQSPRPAARNDLI